MKKKLIIKLIVAALAVFLLWLACRFGLDSVFLYKCRHFPQDVILVDGHYHVDGDVWGWEKDGQWYDIDQCPEIPGYRVEVEPAPAGEAPFIRVSRDAGCGLHVEFAAKAGHWGSYTLTWCGILLRREDCDLPFRHEIHIE